MRILKINFINFEGVRPDSLGGYFIGLGLLSALSQEWPKVRGCWRNGCFCIVMNDVSRDDIENFLLKNWNAPQYERWWSGSQKADTKAKSDRNLWQRRSEEGITRVIHLDAHIVGVGRNQFNPIFGKGGEIGNRNLEEAYKKAKDLIKLTTNPASERENQIRSWLKYTLWAEGEPKLPELSSTGTWFVFANKTFNSGQGWYEKGKISPWSFLLALEGALLLVGSANRRLSSISRPYAVFPFVTDRPTPKAEGEVGLARAEFWAPLWESPASLLEVRALLERGLARIGNRDCRAPHEFALAARAAGVDAGVKEFARFVLRQTNSSRVYEAIPQEHVEVSPVATIESELIEPLLPWLDRLPYEPSDSEQRGKFKGLRGPVEDAIIKIAERPENAERWQHLLLLLADVQARVDRNQNLRKSCAAIPRLSSLWFDKAWPEPPIEIRIARAIASIGAETDRPILRNIFGVDGKGQPYFPTERPQSAVWHHGDVVRVLADVLERRLIDVEPTKEVPLAACHFCRVTEVEEFLEGNLDWEMIGRWVPALSLIRWSWPQEQDQNDGTIDAHAVGGHYLLSALFRPFFCARRIELGGQDLFPRQLKPKTLIARRLLNLIRQGELEEAIKLAKTRYLAANFPIVVPPLVETERYDVIAASLLIPVFVRDIVAGLRRWIQPEKLKEVQR